MWWLSGRRQALSHICVYPFSRIAWTVRVWFLTIYKLIWCYIRRRNSEIRRTRTQLTLSPRQPKAYTSLAVVGYVGVSTTSSGARYLAVPVCSLEVVISVWPFSRKICAGPKSHIIGAPELLMRTFPCIFFVKESQGNACITRRFQISVNDDGLMLVQIHNTLYHALPLDLSKSGKK